jgi:hypothetical protein
MVNAETVTYTPQLKLYIDKLMLSQEQINEVVEDTNDSCLRLYEFYVTKKNWKHFNPIDYTKIGNVLRWSASKTEKCKCMLTKAGYLLIKKDTLSDGTKIFRILVGKEVVKLYKNNKILPTDKNQITYTKK